MLNRGLRRKILLSVVPVLAAALAATASGTAAGHVKHQKPVRGGTITIAIDADPTGFDPAKDSVPSPDAESIVRSIFDTVVIPDDSGGYKPYLAQSVTPNKKANIWTIKLRPGLRFSDGTPLNAAAIKYDCERMNIEGFAGKNTWVDLKRVDVVNKLTARVVLKGPVGALPVSLYSQLGWLGSPTAYKKEGKDFSKHPVGSGPYRLVSWTPGSEAVLERNPYYWRKPMPYFNRVIFKVITSPQARFAALQAGNVDAAEIDPTDAARARQSHYTVRAATVGVTELAINTTVPPLNDIRVREAMAAAINRKAVIDTVWAGAGSVTDSIAPPGNAFHVRTGMQGYDPAKAKKLVDAYKASTGHTPSFTISTANDPQSELFAQVVQRDFQQVGINATVGQPQDAATVSLALIERKYQVGTSGIPGFLDPDIWWLAIYHSPDRGGILNIYGYTNRTIDKALDLAHSSLNLKVRKKEYAIVQKQVASNVYTIPIRGNFVAEAYAPDIRGANGWRAPDGKIDNVGQDFRIPFRVESLWRTH